MRGGFCFGNQKSIKDFHRTFSVCADWSRYRICASSVCNLFDRLAYLERRNPGKNTQSGHKPHGWSLRFCRRSDCSEAFPGRYSARRRISGDRSLHHVAYNLLGDTRPDYTLRPLVIHFDSDYCRRLPRWFCRTKEKEKMSRPRGEKGTPVLAVLSACFLAGGVLGYLSACTEITAGIASAFLSQTVGGVLEQPSVLRETWILLRWPLAIIVLGRFPHPDRSLPLLFLLRGYLLSIGISAFAAENGAVGWVCSVLLFGPACLFTLPVFFLLGVNQLKREKGNHTAAWVLTAGVCISALMLCGLLDCKVMPALLKIVLIEFK